MNRDNITLPDFENPSFLFKMEDILKDLLGGPFLYNKYFSTFGLKGNETVLDFGCGGGTGSIRLARLLNREGRLICLDTSTYWTEKARKRLRNFNNADVIKGNIDEADIQDSSLNVITTIHVIHDIAPLQRMSTIKSLASKLKPGGRFFIKEPTKESHGMPVSEIREIFKQSGLQETEYHIDKKEYSGIYTKPV
jgi:ubiquinone/menaquinone biosynthesis C-methylase UbiE